MNALPLHPALVHLPIAFVLFAPIFAAYVAFDIARTARLIDPAEQAFAQSVRARWSPIVLWTFVQTLLVYATMVSGEQDADLAKNHPAFAASAARLAAIDAHENAAGLLLLASVACLLTALLAWKPGPAAKLWRRVTIGVQLAAVLVCLHTARLGGELVYKHGAADVHLPAKAGAPASAGPDGAGQ